ncbi:MAG: twin-arginine translocase TatA/TatE family subunit [Bacteroidales bacterium]|nr:twin-arginine translocase TatA/TatE family subunit [Bacteroidales bacterium]MDY6394772.1 twin-arginine translocase TatA/TatE family subunit [Bacteroidales bacterium]MDY6395618.1 twin-arginine translocase TatA/TatE family subunit [Bacteroidales bacterium]MDY6402473.1 twin-arginine translocase TatA/TatE family subunit [Bacteroidales bacterium]MDY6424542.1 twin-arginine translocase TatA/TatE family subunit [Bacteroidales bacterium]
MLHLPVLMIGTTELIVIGGAVLLLFGGKKIPELMRSLGRGVKEYKQGLNGEENSKDQPQEESSQTDETNEQNSSINNETEEQKQ